MKPQPSVKALLIVSGGGGREDEFPHHNKLMKCKETNIEQ